MSKRYENINAWKDDDDFGAVLNCAVRYCLGRRTYMPDLVASWIRGNCKGILTNRTLSTMIYDIESFGNNGPEAYGDDCDRETWMKFLQWLKEEKNALAEREKD